MKMKMNRILGLAAVAAVTIALAPVAGANCIPDKTIATFGTASLVYVVGAGSSDAVTGQFWQHGLAANNSGTYTEWVFQDVSGISANASLGDSRVNGCPANVADVVIESNDGTNAKFVVASVGELNLSEVNFDLGAGHGNYNLTPIPRPRVGNSGRSGTNVNLTGVGLDGVTGAAQAASGGSTTGLITGFEIMKASGADPGRDASLWTSVTVVPSAGGNPVSGLNIVADCSNPAVDQFYAVRMNFADGRKSSYVGASTRVNCNPSLADPKYRPVPRKGNGIGTTKN